MWVLVKEKSTKQAYIQEKIGIICSSLVVNHKSSYFQNELSYSILYIQQFTERPCQMYYKKGYKIPGLFSPFQFLFPPNYQCITFDATPKSIIVLKINSSTIIAISNFKVIN